MKNYITLYTNDFFCNLIRNISLKKDMTVSGFCRNLIKEFESNPEKYTPYSSGDESRNKYTTRICISEKDGFDAIKYQDIASKITIEVLTLLLMPHLECILDLKLTS